MSEHELPGLPPDVLAMLAAEKRCAPPSATVANDVLARLNQSLGLLESPAPGPPHAGAGSSSIAPPATMALASSTLSKGLAVITVGVVLAASVWLVRRGHRPAASERAVAGVPVRSGPTALQNAPPPPAVAPRPLELPRPSAPTVAIVAEPRVQNERATPASSPAPRPASSSRGSPLGEDERDRALTNERTLLDQARRALAQRDGDAAMTALRTHARRFPSGRLAEEREVMWVQALALAGRTDEARARGVRFRRSFPSSAFLPSLEESLRISP